MVRAVLGMGVLAGFLGLAGCTMCCHPNYRCGPVYENGCQSCCPTGRAGSILEGSGCQAAGNANATIKSTAKRGDWSGNKQMLAAKNRSVRSASTKKPSPNDTLAQTPKKPSTKALAQASENPSAKALARNVRKSIHEDPRPDARKSIGKDARPDLQVRQTGQTHGRIDGRRPRDFLTLGGMDRLSAGWFFVEIMLGLFRFLCQQKWDCPLPRHNCLAEHKIPYRP